MKIILSFIFFISFLMGCVSTSTISTKEPEHTTYQIESSILKEKRTINVYRPANISKTKKIPVLYMPDGGLDEDFPHVAQSIDSLIKIKKIDPIMLVGIANTQRRRDLTGPTEVKEDKEIAPVVGGSQAFRSFIISELIPFVENHYATTNKKGIIGESLAGLFVVETLLTSPSLFDFYIAFDPSLWWNDQYLLKHTKEYLATFPNKPIQFWFAGSDVQIKYDDITKFETVLKSSAPSTLKWQYNFEAEEQHSTIFKATKVKALLWTLGK